MVRFDARGLAYPVLLDPVIEIATWDEFPLIPPRYDTAMTSLGDRVVVFGGTGPERYVGVRRHHLD